MSATRSTKDARPLSGAPRPGFWAGYLVFLREHKPYYLVPIALALVALAAFVVAASDSVAPFVYQMF